MGCIFYYAVKINKIQMYNDCNAITGFIRDT